jgi:hypothetical protein
MVSRQWTLTNQVNKVKRENTQFEYLFLIWISCFVLLSGPFSTVEYHMVPGPFSDYLAFENPLDGRLTLVKETQKKSHQKEVKKY